MMTLTAFAAIVTLVAFPSLVNCSEIFDLIKYIRPFLLNQHPIFVTCGKVPLPDKNFQTVHAEEISSVLVYDFKKMQIAELAQTTRWEENCNITGTFINRFIWRRLPSIINIFPDDPSKDVYGCQYIFLLKSGLGFRTRPKINSVIITLENSTIHQNHDAQLYRNLNTLMFVESLVDYYEFALHLKPTKTKSLSSQPYVVSSVSVLKFCFGIFVSSKISFLHFERCDKSKLNVQYNNFNCVNKLLQFVSETNLNLSRFGIELEARDIETHGLYGNCLTPKMFKNDLTLTFSSNYKNIFIQNVLLQELFRGLPVLNNCNKESNKNVIVINVRFSPQNTYRNVRYEFQVSGSFQTQEAFNFLTCDNVKKKSDFMAYLEPFDARTWFGTIISLAIYSSGMATLIYRKQKISLIDICVRSLLTNFSLLTGIANTSVKLLTKNHMNATRILMLFWSIATFILCIIYSSLVTSNVIAPSTLVSPWTDYKQLGRFTKVFGLNNEEMLRMDRISKHNKSDHIYRLVFPTGSKVSRLWFTDMQTQLLSIYNNQTKDCDFVFSDSLTCPAFRKKLYKFINSYRYAVRTNFQKLKEILSVCTNTAYVDTETSIDQVLQIFKQDKSVPTMVKGNSFFQQSHYWTMSYTWLLRKLMVSRLQLFTTSGIIAFWERFCSKYCKQRPEHSAIHTPVMNSQDRTFKSQELESNLTSLFFLILIMSTISIFCFVVECCFTIKTAQYLHVFFKTAEVSCTKNC
jgi:hypothetical protein